MFKKTLFCTLFFAFLLIGVKSFALPSGSDWYIGRSHAYPEAYGTNVHGIWRGHLYNYRPYYYYYPNYYRYNYSVPYRNYYTEGW